MRSLTNFYDLKYNLLKSDCHSKWISKMQSGTSEERYAIQVCFKLGKNATETYGILQAAFGASCMNQASVSEWHKRFKETRESVRDNERCGRSKEVNTPELIGQRVLVRVTMLRFYGSSGGDSVGRGQPSSNRACGISSRTMHQSTTPSFSQTIWPRWASRQFSTVPIVQTLLPVTFGYSLAQRLSLWDNWGDGRDCDEEHWQAHTRGLPWGLPKVVVRCNQCIAS